MALRRKLPSRMTPDAAPESAAAPAKPENPPRRTEPAPAAAPVQEAAPAPAQPVVSQADALAAAAASAFGTVGTARVLEDSFTPAPAVNEPEISEPAIVPQPVAVPQPEPVAEESTPAAIPEPEFTAPAWEAPAAPAIAAAPMLPAEIAPEAPAAEPEPAFTAPAWDMPAPQPEVAAPTPQPAPVEESQPAEEPIFVAPAWEALAEPQPSAATQPEPVAEPRPEPAAGPERVTDFMPKDDPSSPSFQPSRPDNSSRRRTREKRPRDFTAMGAPENQQPERPKPAISFAANVPVNTISLDKVDADLIATGIMAPPPADSLTSSLPTGIAETESAFTPPPYEPAPVFTPPAPRQEAEPAPQPEPIRFEPQPEPQPAPAAVRQPEPAPEEEPQPVIRPEPARASFNLSSQQRAEPLPPPQSDLPWTQPQAAAEWEIETPQSQDWHMDAAPDTPSPSHMPPPGDLYGTMGNAPSAPVPPFAAPPRAGNNYTPEIPTQRRRQAGTPWALVAVAGLVAVAAGAWYMRSGGSQQAQQQLAQLTSGAREDATATPDGILAPPRADGGASFYTPPLASDISSSAMVNFADVPPEQAGQPIVADGSEQMPENMGFFNRLNEGIDKARAAKEGAADMAEISATAIPTLAASNAAAERQRIQDELAAYRSALAQSPNPSDLTPANFRRDPDGYMDGKAGNAPQGQMASGQLLPPPTGAEGGAVPPAELYTNNPANLPVVAEPVAGVPQRVRTLADFPDVEAYMPEREKVEIPRNLKPKLAATDFPSLEVLSFVPGKGIVAFADGREGVLLIGESINGWELVAVSPENAQFKTGQRSHQVTAEN